MLRRVLSVAVGAAMIAAVPTIAHAAPRAADGPEVTPQSQRAHNLESVLSAKQDAMRSVALQQVVTGKAEAKGANQVVKIGKGQFVELAREDEDAIWTVLGEFDELRHNEIPEPDRTVDNTTIWTADFSRAYFDTMLYSSEKGVNSVANYYEEQSSNRYSVTGEVEDWVTVDDHSAAYYGEGDNDQRTWEFLNETLTSWYEGQIAAGKSKAEIEEYLSQFDVWDRYDYDGDGNFDESDGYIDHFQAVHAGMGEEVGGGVLGEDAIWSHRWYNQTNQIGTAGPTLDDGTTVPNGGAPVGDTKYWVGDYTVEPENGGVGVFAHEFGHDLGLPDLYDISGNTGGAENSTGFWTLMSSGSYGNSGKPEDGIGTKPTHMGAWEKLQLGWLNYEAFDYREKGTVKVGPAEYNTKNAQAVITVLPANEVTTTIGEPFEGEDFWYSDQGNDLDQTMVADVSGTTLTAQVNYEIEENWDYAYAGYVDSSGAFVSLPTNLSTDNDDNGQNFGHGITGSTDGEWVELTVDISSVPAGAAVGFRYWTDGAAVEPGFMVDAVAVDGTSVTEWTLDGFIETTGSITEEFFNAYIGEYRTYIGYDKSLLTGPYNFGFPNKPDWAERFPYQDGLLISYWNTAYSDNNVGDHPGAGLVLPVDAHPGPLYEPTDDEADDQQGETWRPRIQSYDSTFSRQRTDRIVLHDPDTGTAKAYGLLPAVPWFDDRRDWYVEAGSAPDADGWTGVDVPKTGTTIRIMAQNPRAGLMQVRIN